MSAASYPQPPSNQRGFLRAPFPGDDDFDPPELPRDWRAKLEDAKGWLHIGVGLVAFLFVALAISRLVGWFFFFEALGLKH